VHLQHHRAKEECEKHLVAQSPIYFEIKPDVNVNETRKRRSEKLTHTSYSHTTSSHSLHSHSNERLAYVAYRYLVSIIQSVRTYTCTTDWGHDRRRNNQSHSTIEVVKLAVRVESVRLFTPGTATSNIASFSFFLPGSCNSYLEQVRTVGYSNSVSVH
jgi:hypothetical protein